MDAANALARGLASHPLAQRYAQKMMARNSAAVRTPGDVLGERLGRVAVTLLAATSSKLATSGFDVDGKDAGDLPYALAEFVDWAIDAPPYLWTNDVLDGLRSSIKVADDGKSIVLPRHVISPRLLAAPRMWWTFESGLTLDEGELRRRIHTVLLADTGKGIVGYFVGDIRGSGFEHIHLQREVIDYGKTYPDDFVNDDAGRAFAANVLMFCAFLNSPYIPKSTERPSRSERREAARRARFDAGEEVTFITLRRPESTQRTDSDAERPVDWQHRWVVSGHYRAQWYPSEHAHHVIWIAPYLKGPEDAPMIDHAYRIAR